jgi:hypothetical protein
VVILIAVLLVLTLLNAPKYQAEDTPKGVVHNYLLALRLKEYERARSYLSPSLPGYPADADQFAADVDQLTADFDHPPYDVNWYKNDAALAVESAQVDADWASVRVRKTKLQVGDLFESGQSSYTFSVSLRREDGAWKISWAEWYWSDCWTNRSRPGCR